MSKQIIDLFTILDSFYNFALILFISFSSEPSRQYGISLFFKHFFNNRNDCKRVSGKSRFFSIVLPIELPIDLPIELPIGLPIGLPIVLPIVISIGLPIGLPIAFRH